MATAFVGRRHFDDADLIERRFELAEHIRVSGASLVNGLLHVELVKEVPEAKKPRTVKIETVAPKQANILENQAA